MNRKLYIHELIDIIGHNRARYMHHMTANWCPVGSRERNMSCFGVWATVGSTGAWPQVVNLWELNGWEGLAANFEHELVGGGAQDPSLAEWWAAAAGAAARRLRPDRRARAVEPDDRRADQGRREGRGVRARDRADAGRRRSRAFLDALAETGRPAVEELGLQCVGAFRVAMATDTEAIVIWAIPDLATWAAFERAWDRRRARAVAAPARSRSSADVHRTLMVDAPLSPMRIGRQPAVSDRRPLSEIGP